MNKDILIIDMNPRATECHICDEPTDGSLGIPMYEDIVLHNDYAGEWFGQAACPQCFQAQSQLIRPVSSDQLRSTK